MALSADGSVEWGVGQALGIDQLHGAVDRGGCRDVVGQGERDGASRLVEHDRRHEGAADQELEIVELAWCRAVLRGLGHTRMLGSARAATRTLSGEAVRRPQFW